MMSVIRTVVSFILNVPCIPSVNKAISCKFPPLMSIKEIKWQYWAIILPITYITMGQFYDLELQKSINYVREICRCDLIYLVRKADIAEAIMLYFNRNYPDKLRDYFVCRSICP
jgi:ABC-type microcin C transport system permease subunit YejB